MFDSSLWILLIAFSAISACIFGLLSVLLRGDRRLDRRIEELPSGARFRARLASQVASQVAEDPSPSPWSRLGSLLAPREATDRTRLQSRLIQAGIYSPSAVPIFLTTKLLMTIVPPVLAILLATLTSIPSATAMFFGLVGGGAGNLLPGMWVDSLRSKRQRAIARSLPDFLDLTVTCLEGGLSFDGCLQRVSDELGLAAPVLAGELGRVQLEIQLGQTADAALANFAERSDSPAIKTLATLVRQARSLGTGVAEALRVHADMIRVQREYRAEEMAQKAAVKILFPTLLLIFPAVFIVLAGPAAIQLSERLLNAP